MKTIKTLLLFAAIFATTAVFSQTASKKTMLSIGAELGIPVDDFSNGYNVGYGGSLKAAFPATTNGHVTLSAGAIHFGGKGIIPDVTLYPLKAGFLYRFNPHGFYLEPQVGYTPVSGGGSGAFTWAGNVGYFILEHFDVALRFEGLEKSAAKGGSLYFVGLRAAYNFKL